MELFAALEGAKVLALSDAAMLDMIVDEKELTCGIANMKQSKQSTENDMEDDISDIFEEDEDNEILLDQPVQNGDTDSSLLEVEAESELTRLSSAPSNTRIDQRFVDVLNNDGCTKSLLKSTVIWALTESKGYLSKDRLKRVQSRIAAETPRKRGRKRKLDQANLVADVETPSKRQKTQTSISHANELSIGDWALFENVSDENSIFVFGMVLGSRYILAKTEKDKKYTFDFAPTSYQGPTAENTPKRGVEVLSTWFDVDTEFRVQRFHGKNSFFIDIEKYIGTIEMQGIIKKIENVTLNITLNDIENIQTDKQK